MFYSIKLFFPLRSDKAQVLYYMCKLTCANRMSFVEGAMCLSAQMHYKGK